MSDSWPYDRPPPAASAPPPDREHILATVLMELRRSAELGAITPAELAMLEADRPEDLEAAHALGHRVFDVIARTSRQPIPGSVRAAAFSACIIAFLPPKDGGLAPLMGWWEQVERGRREMAQEQGGERDGEAAPRSSTSPEDQPMAAAKR